jgi:hypothetical protein
MVYLSLFLYSNNPLPHVEMKKWLLSEGSKQHLSASFSFPEMMFSYLPLEWIET